MSNAPASAPGNAAGIDDPRDARTLYAVLLWLGAGPSHLERLGEAAGHPLPAPGDPPPASTDILHRLAATPEQRQTLAERFGWTYAELTDWAARADLLRPALVARGLTPDVARTLVAAGIRGVHDLGMFHRRVPIKARGRFFDTVARSERVRTIVGETELDWASILGTARDIARGRRPKPIPAGAARPASRGSPTGASAPHAASHGTAEPRLANIATGVEAVVVVKGAGGQAADDTLAQFMRGFWPAMKAVDREATVHSRRTGGPTGEMIEVESGNRRIWLTEAYWEKDIRPAAPGTVFWAEWDAALYAYMAMPAPDLLRPEVPRKRKWWIGLGMVVWLEYMLLAFFGGLILYFDRVQGNRVMDLPFLSRGVELDLTHRALTWLGWSISDAAVLWFIPAVIGVILFAYLAAVTVHRVLDVRAKRNHWPYERQQFSRWVPYLLLLVTFVVSPVWYLTGLVLILTVNIVLQAVRDIAWPIRRDFGTDLDFGVWLRRSERSDLDEAPRAAPHAKPARTVAGWLREYWLPHWLYRFTVVLALPLVSIAYAAIRVLNAFPKSIPIFGSIAGTISTVVSAMISGAMGDITVYATDPAQSPRIRAALEDAIHWFAGREEVDHVHVVAHSQGTPIAYETLFHYLPAGDRAKVTSFVTIGSVLNYYHHITDVLDRLVVERFPVRAAPQFPPGFRWINLWNTGDPIPEFQALEGYGDGFGGVGPTNIKTRAALSPVHSHTTYWDDTYDLHIPFALRLLGDGDPEEWDHPAPEAWHARWVEQRNGAIVTAGDGAAAPSAGAVRDAALPDAAPLPRRHRPSASWWAANGPRRLRGPLARMEHVTLTFGLWVIGLSIVLGAFQVLWFLADGPPGDAILAWIGGPSSEQIQATLKRTWLDGVVSADSIHAALQWLSRPAIGREILLLLAMAITLAFALLVRDVVVGAVGWLLIRPPDRLDKTGPKAPVPMPQPPASV